MAYAYMTPTGATGSSALSGDYVGSKAIDGSTDSAWVSANKDAGTNIIFDLGVDKLIDKIKAYVEGSYDPEVCDLYLSSNGTNYTLTLENCTFSIGNAWNEVSLASPAVGRYIKLIMKSSLYTYYQLAEFQVSVTAAGYLENGTCICYPIALDVILATALMKWTHLTPANTTVTVETAVNEDDEAVPESFTAQTSGQVIASLPEGSLAGHYLWIKITLTTTDGAVTPTITRLWFE